MKYWTAVFSHSVWRDFQETKFQLLGFARGVRLRAKKPRRGDVVLCCVLPENRWVGAFEIHGTAKISSRVYRADLPVTYRVKLLAVVPIELAQPAVGIRDLVDARQDFAVSRSPYEFRKSRDAIKIFAQLRTLDPDSGVKTDRPSVPEELLRACRGGECVAYIGSGLTAAGGMPTWGPFVSDLMEWSIGQKYFEQDYANSLREAVKQNQFNDVADTIVSRVEDKKLLADYLKTVFQKDKAPSLKTFDLLRQIPFSALLTTNFDDLLERSFGSQTPVYTPLDAEELVATQTTRPLYILKLYGTLQKPESLLVAPAHYAAAVASNIPFSRYMQGLFVSRTLLFLGASLEGISTYLGGLDFRGGTIREHYALVPVQGTAWRPKADLLQRRYGIRVLPFSPSPDFREVEQFLTEFRNEVLAATQGSAPRIAVRSTVKKSRLKRVLLENIGPFDNLELDFDHHWNVIVGDNGVGKSAILKAIAVGITGEDSAQYAHRLVKAGQRGATITLETNQETKYVTKILLKDGTAFVDCKPTRPLEAEGWLALGFPALRTITWQQAKEFTSEGAPRIHSQDLLPLVSGDPDPRMDGLKQWLINLDYKILTSAESKRGKTQFDERRREFAEIIQSLLPGAMLQFAPVDRKNKQVMVKTPEATLPLESVSQGATSFLGWVGVVLQRLYDLYLFQPVTTDETQEPLKQFALVLVDEIDAHMHPGWQRTVVEDVSRVCPNAQFIATTHSPLIVANLQPNQVYALHRGQPPQRPEESLEGYRADQILTLPIFNLDTTVSIESEKALADYSELLRKTSRSGQEEAKLSALEKRIGSQWPSHPETVRGRQDLRQAEETAMAELKSLPASERKKIVENATQSLSELL